MKYKDILGFSKKQFVKKSIRKNKENQIINGIKQDLNEWSDTTFRNKPKRWSKNTFDTGLTEFEKQGGEEKLELHNLKQISKKYLDLEDRRVVRLIPLYL